MKKTPASKAPPNFEASLQRLETIVEMLEEGNTPLDEVMKMYEEGIQLSKDCLARLSEAEVKLKKLSKDMDGRFKFLDEDKE